MTGVVHWHVVFVCWEGVSGGLESALVGHGIKVGPHLHTELFQFEEPEVVAHKGNLFGTLCTGLHVEKITSANERLRLPPAGIHAVDGSSTLLPVDSHALVKTLLVATKPFETHAQVLVTTLHNLDSVAVDLAHRADSCVGVIQFVEGRPILLQRTSQVGCPSGAWSLRSRKSQT